MVPKAAGVGDGGGEAGIGSVGHAGEEDGVGNGEVGCEGGCEGGERGGGGHGGGWDCDFEQREGGSGKRREDGRSGWFWRVGRGCGWISQTWGKSGAEVN